VCECLHLRQAPLHEEVLKAPPQDLRRRRTA
jgi:hypothetical protein